MNPQPTVSPGARLRLIADDLTGALDAAAEFATAAGPIRVGWGQMPARLPADFVYDTATRETDAATASARLSAAAAGMGLCGAAIAFLKLDSLLRGNGGHEIVACLAGANFTRAIVAPAFPFQRRFTRGGRQYAPSRTDWVAVGEDLAASLKALGVTVTPCRPGDRVPDGVSLWDADSDDDLRTIANAGRRLGGRSLWVGSGGLAHALADRPNEGDIAWPQALAGPVLGLFGSDHPVTKGQLQTAAEACVRLADGGAASVRRLVDALGDSGCALATFDLPPVGRAAAAAHIASALADLAARLDPPATLICGGGETLRALCESLGTQALDVSGRIMPGVPLSRMLGGRWDGVKVISKSGAFGEPDLLARLAGLPRLLPQRNSSIMSMISRP